MSYLGIVDIVLMIGYNNMKVRKTDLTLTCEMKEANSYSQR